MSYKALQTNNSTTYFILLFLIDKSIEINVLFSQYLFLNRQNLEFIQILQDFACLNNFHEN
jgi:hypothetical protein